MKNKKGIILGVANNRSIAWGIAKALKTQGAELALTYPDNDKLKKRVENLAESIDCEHIFQYDASSNKDGEKLFENIKKSFGKIDFIVHSIAYCSTQSLKGKFVDLDRESFLQAMEISCYSLIDVVKHLSPLMNDGGSIVSLSYIGARSVMFRYGSMGVCKSALESAVRYLAVDLGEKDIRINAISSGPIKTLAASALNGLDHIIDHTRNFSAIRKNVTIEDSANTALYLLSDLSKNITAQTLYVDAGYSSMGYNPNKQ